MGAGYWGNLLTVGETIAARYTAFTIQDDGALTDRRIWAQVAPTPELTTLAEPWRPYRSAACRLLWRC